MKIKELVLSICVLAVHAHAFSQQPATGSGSTTITPWNPSTSSFAWFRGGNFPGGAAGTNNIFGTRWNSPIYTITNGSARMVMAGGGIGTNAGNVAIGNNLSGNFVPVNRFHLHQLGVDTFGIQFTNSTLAAIPTATDGFAMNLENAGNFVFRQYENRNVRFVMPGNVFASPVTLMQLTWNLGPENRGQVQMRPGPNAGIPSFYNPALLNLGGAIGFSDTVGPAVTNTLMYYNTRIAGATNAPANDGFRIQYAFNSEGTNNGDGLVFEKTDGQSAEPDGCIKFTNYGTDNIQRLSMTIEGNGHIGIGRPYNTFIVPWRRLSVQDTLTQFRMTYQAANTIGAEIYTDFFTDNNGDLHIDPRYLNDTNARVVKINYGTGLNQPFAGLSLDVNGQANIRTVNQDTVSNYVLVWDDTTGNVRYRDIGTLGSTLGGLCVSPSTAPVLAGDWEIPMNTNNFVFTDPTGTLLDGDNFVGIGTTCTPGAKLDVIRSITTNTLPLVVAARSENRDIALSTPYMGGAYGVSGTANGTNRENVGVYGDAINGSGNIGVRGRSSQAYASATFALNNVGTWGEASNGLSNTGILGVGTSTNPLSAKAHGGLFTAAGTNLNYGTYATATNGATGYDNIGSFNVATTAPTGTTTNNVGVVGIATINPGGAATNSVGVYGEGAIAVYLAGPLVSGAPFSFSDQKLKDNVKTLESGLELLKKLNPVTYNHKTDAYPEMHLREGKQYGFIAQEVATVIPELVTETHKPEFKDEQGNVISKGGDFKALNYDGLIPVLTKSIQEQQSEIETLKSELEALKAILTNANNVVPNSGSNSTTVELSDVKSIVLDQNTPNPFAEQTTITYTLTDAVAKAQILFYNAEGKLINSVDLEAKAGKGSVHVFANDLSNGMYTYTLIADGQVIDTKRMVKNQ